MDVTKHLRRWLNDSELARMADRYEGIIAGVIEEPIRNRFTGNKQLEPVILFEDGWRLVPNIGMRKALVESHGRDTDEWIGRRIVVVRRRVEKHSNATGELVVRFEKRVQM